MQNRIRNIAFLFTTFVLASLLLGACHGTRATATPAPVLPTTQPTATAVPVPTEASAPPTGTPPTVLETPAPAATQTSAPPSPTETQIALPTSPALAGVQLVFASYKEPAVDVEPAIQHEAIAPDLNNVQVPFVLSVTQRERLARDGFVVSPGVEKEFFTVYEKARYANVPIFVTSDSLLHVYHLLFDKVLRTAEVQQFIPLLRDLNRALLAQAESQFQALQGTGWEDAARRTVAFVGVASRLLDPDVQVPGYAADLVEGELALVEEAAGIQLSPLFPGLESGEDYTQYIPRGHYTRSEELSAYFKSMMWYGRMTFRLKRRDPEVGKAETRSALLLVHALRTAEVNGRPALEAWADLYNPTVFFVGRSDDLTVLQYLEVIDQVYGPGASVTTLADDALLDAFIAEADKLPPPRILGMVIEDIDDEEEMTKGLRFMGQRFVPDAYIFRQLVYRNVGTRDHRRGLPKGLDLLAAMGSQRAYQLLDEMGETAFENYPQQMAKVQAWVSSLSVKEWTETLYNSWLYCFRPLLDVPGEGYPAFMQSPAWVDKQLHTVLGSWAELKHDTILYAKQVYAELGAGPMPPEPVPPKGYVEPVPHFYARLAALTAMTREGLASRGLLAEGDDRSLGRLEELARAFQTMAEKELQGQPLTQEEYDTIRFYGGELEHLTMAAADTPAGEPGALPYMDEEPQAAVIADVATDPDPAGVGIPAPIVLEEAVGRVNEIYVVAPVVEEDGTTYLQVAKGGVFSYYEFPWPADDRLTDEKWRQMLDEGQAPPPPAWIESFFTDEGEYSELAAAIFRFQKSVSAAVWYLEAGELRAEGLERLRDQIEALRAETQYEGRQLVRSSFRSFDLQAQDRAVITVREIWQDQLYTFRDFPGEGGEALAQRGPYTLDVTFTLERVESGWQVTRVVYANEPPVW
ncbi:MAG: DUF3160 domain-containing protein [Anaerolineae bacterium]|nr:MAG: DUF3160 domain-containing protein [Anaerolineae bacterium]